MPTPEQSRLTTPHTVAGQQTVTALRARARQINDVGFTTPSSAPTSARPPTPDYAPMPGEDQSIGILEQTFNRLPFFVEYDRRLVNPAGTTTLTATTTTDMDLNTDGLFSIPFEKSETWTDVKIRFAISGQATDVSTVVVISGTITDQAGVEYPVTLIARFLFLVADVILRFDGERRVSNLPPGKYTLQFSWRVSANDFIVGTNDSIHASVTEMIPVPATIQVGE